MSKNETSIVKDTDGNTIAEIGGEKAKNKVSASEIPNNLKNAYVAIEDERFYKHHGAGNRERNSAGNRERNSTGNRERNGAGNRERKSRGRTPKEH